MKCKEVDTYFKSQGKWVNWEKTTDIFSFGSPENEIDKMAVVWKPTLDALKKAAALNANFIICHESIAVKAVNGSMRQDDEFMLESESELFDFLKSSSLAVYRCHDFLDGVPQWGVMHAWQRGLNLGGEIVVEEYPNIITEISPMTANDLSEHVIRQTTTLGQNYVLLSGNPERLT